MAAAAVIVSEYMPAPRVLGSLLLMLRIASAELKVAILVSTVVHKSVVTPLGEDVCEQV